MAKFDLGAVWADAMAIGRAGRDLILPLAGLFLFLPSVIGDQFIVYPQAVDPAAASDVLMGSLAGFVRANWPVLLVSGIITSFGTLAILALVLRAERPTVAEAMHVALRALPVYLVASIVQSTVIASGMMLFIIPGIYMIGRLLLVASVSAAEGARNPIAPLARSIALTHGHGWQAAALVSILFAVGMVISIVATSLTGTFFTLVLPAEFARLAQTIVSAFVETALVLVIILACAALYRALAMRALNSRS